MNFEKFLRTLFFRTLLVDASSWTWDNRVAGEKKTCFNRSLLQLALTQVNAF